MMEDVLVGVLAIAVGALFCFRGYLALRVIIPLWGSFAGFLLGAGLVANTGSDGFLRSGLAWAVGLAVAVVFGALAYLYFEVSVVLTMASIGFALGTTLMATLGVRWSWLVVVVGVGLGTLLAVVAVIGDLPGMLLTFLSALAGASAIVAGTMLITGVLGTSQLTSPATTERLDDGWWWYALYVGLVVAGLVAQGRATARVRQSLRSSWVEAGGRELRAT
jgi:hypothetical protein